MIILSIKFILLCIVAYIIKSIYDLLDFNKDASLITMDVINKERIKLGMSNKNPLVISYPTNFTTSLEELNQFSPGYIINDKDKLISLELLINSEKALIHKNSSMCKELLVDKSIQPIYDLFKQDLDVNATNYISLYKGDTLINLTKNMNSTLLFKALCGTFTFHIFNPKHENEIRGEQPSKIKKWGIKINVTTDTILYIPPEWNYIYESTEEAILLEINTDTYPTFLYNYIRKK
jgi:hypothetical protein